MARLKPKIDIGSITTKRDRESFQTFVLEVIKDTFIYEVTPTAISLDGELFTLVLGPVDNTPGDGPDLGTDIYDDTQYFNGSFVQEINDIKGYRFVYEYLVVADSKDYLDVYLYGVKQPNNVYEVDILDISDNILQINSTDACKLKITFTESITRVPTEVVAEFNNPEKPNPFNIKGKITKIV